MEDTIRIYLGQLILDYHGCDAGVNLCKIPTILLDQLWERRLTERYPSNPIQTLRLQFRQNQIKTSDTY